MIALSRAVACGLVRSVPSGTTTRRVAGEDHKVAPLRHMREGPDGLPSRPRDPKPEFEEGYAWGTGSPNVTLFELPSAAWPYLTTATLPVTVPSAESTL